MIYYILDFTEAGAMPVYNNGSNIAFDYIDSGFMPVLFAGFLYISLHDVILLSDSIKKNTKFLLPERKYRYWNELTQEWEIVDHI